MSILWWDKKGKDRKGCSVSRENIRSTFALQAELETGPDMPSHWGWNQKSRPLGEIKSETASVALFVHVQKLNPYLWMHAIHACMQYIPWTRIFCSTDYRKTRAGSEVFRGRARSASDSGRLWRGLWFSFRRKLTVSKKSLMLFLISKFTPSKFLSCYQSREWGTIKLNF